MKNSQMIEEVLSGDIQMIGKHSIDQQTIQ